MSSPDTYCEPCQRDEGNTRAESYCNDCMEPLCDSCSRRHRKRPRTKNHKIIPISKARNLRLSVRIPDTCSNHDDQPFALFCFGHEKICCRICYEESHYNCENVVSIEKASREVNIQNLIDEMENGLTDLKENFSDLISKQNTNIKELEGQKENIKEKITTIRRDINSYLDDLELAAEDDLIQCQRKCQDELEKMVRDFNKRNDKMESWQSTIRNLSDHSIDAKAFISLKVIQQLQEEQQKFIAMFEKDMVTYGLKFTDVKAIENITTNIRSLGSVKIISTENIPKKKSQAGENMEALALQRKPQLICKIDTSVLGSVSPIEDVCLAPENRIVLASHPYLYIYNIQERTVERVGIENGSGDLTCDFQNHVYLSYPGVGIDKVNIKHMKVVKRIYGDHDPGDESYCIRVRNETIYTTEYYNIVLLSLDGQVKKRIPTEIEAVLLCINSKGDIYASDRKRILLVTETGSQSVVYTNHTDGNQIMGIAVDKQDRLIICNSHDKQGTIIRRDTLSETEELILNELKSPSVISSYPSANQLLILTDKGRVCSVYQI